MMMLSVTLRAQTTCSPRVNTDGSADITCSDGTRYLGLTRKQVDDNQIALNEGAAAKLKATKQEQALAEKDIQIRELKLQAELALTQRDLERQKADSLQGDFNQAKEDATRWEGLFQSERELRKESSAFIPHSSVKGFWGKLLTTLDHPASQSFFKMGIPVYQMFRCQ